jgi:hypothetical protein
MVDPHFLQLNYHTFNKNINLLIILQDRLCNNLTFLIRGLVQNPLEIESQQKELKAHQLDPLVIVQQNLRKILADFKSSAENNSALTYLNKQVVLEPMNKVLLWKMKIAIDILQGAFHLNLPQAF